MRSAMPGIMMEMDCFKRMKVSKPNEWMQGFLRFFFKHLYTTFAWSYDLVAYLTSAGQWQTWQESGVDCLPPGQVLEMGYGTGHVLSVLHSKGYKVFGIDSSKQMARIASRRLQQHTFPANLVRAKAQALPFGKNVFHSILSTFPSEFIFNAYTFKEAWRVLKPEGTLVIIPGVSEILGLKAEVNKFLGLLDEFASFLYRITGEAIDPETKIANEFTDRLKNSGFSVDIQFVRQRRAVILLIKAVKERCSNGLTHG